MSLIVVWVRNLLDPCTLIGLFAVVLSGFDVYVMLNASFLLKLKNERLCKLKWPHDLWMYNLSISRYSGCSRKDGAYVR